MHNHEVILILGDLNTENIYLDNKHDKHSGITAFGHLLKNALDMTNLQQIIQEPTSINTGTENLHDLIFTDCDKIINSGTLSSFSNLDHLPVM